MQFHRWGMNGSSRPDGLRKAANDHAAALWLIEFMLWSEEAGISIRSSDISINGQPLDVPRW
ncbi:hypothetical protein ACTAQJ_03080 [Arthrobacter sp. alpha11c]